MIKRYVVKIGSSLLTLEDGTLNKSYLKLLIKNLSTFKQKKNIELIIVTSGSIATGIGKLNIGFSSKNIRDAQALAAIGQATLVNAYEHEFSAYDCMIAQVLLTRRDVQERKSYLNIRNTILTLLNKKVIPIINENDTVSVEEIKFGDNDTIAALVASKVNADYLIMLTDIDGLYDKDPRKSQDANLIKKVTQIDTNLIKYAGSKGTMQGTGGMITKLKAARIAISSGTKVIIANGNNKNVLKHIFSSDDLGTIFLPEQNVISHKKRWLAYNAEVKGTIIIDEGASIALINKGKSLLPAGIIEVTGKFDVGDVVSIEFNNKEIAHGVVSYKSSDIDKIKKCKTCDIGKILGDTYYGEVVHRDNMVLL